MSSHASMLAVALAALPALTHAAPLDLEFRPRLVLHGRYTGRVNYPSRDILYDPATRQFALDDYLRPSERDLYPSAFASLGFDLHALAKKLRLSVTVDSGELRQRSYPDAMLVCRSLTSGTGLDDASADGCDFDRFDRLVAVPLETTGRLPAELTSNGRPIEDELSRNWLVREAYLRATFGKSGFISTRLGRKRFSIGDGFLYDDYATGAELDFDVGALGPQLDVGFSAFIPSRDFFAVKELEGPMVALRVDYLPSLFEHAGLFAAGYRDVSGSVSELLRSADVEASVLRIQDLEPFTATYQQEQRRLAAALARPTNAAGTVAHLLWLGTSGSLLPRRGHLAQWTAALLVGEGAFARADSLGKVTGIDEVPIFGKLLNLRYKVELPRDFTVGAWFLYLSGDLPPEEKRRLGRPQRYDGFLGIAPYITATNIFFNGGVAETFAARKAAAPGVNARGAIAPGLTASYEPLEQLSFDLKGAYLFADEIGPYGGRTYGPELDLNVTYAPLDWLLVAAEGDVLIPGNFFRGGAPIYKFVIGVDFVYF